MLRHFPLAACVREDGCFAAQVHPQSLLNTNKMSVGGVSNAFHGTVGIEKLTIMQNLVAIVLFEGLIESTADDIGRLIAVRVQGSSYLNVARSVCACKVLDLDGIFDYSWAKDTRLFCAASRTACTPAVTRQQRIEKYPAVRLPSMIYFAASLGIKQTHVHIRIVPAVTVLVMIACEVHLELHREERLKQL